jgi:chemotaxis protein methyltransferase CheR
MAHALAENVLSGVRDAVADLLGLHFPESRWADLERGIASAARELGETPARCAERILRRSNGDAIVEVLARHLTVGETYFFREKEMLETFEQQILPELLRKHAADGDRRIRIWSAGCSTGEEPYTIAILLDRAIPGIDSWSISILATDINSLALQKAGKAEYGPWSFRGTPAAVRDRYFTQHGGDRFELIPKIRSRVTCATLNLAMNAYPSAANGTTAMDVIFCRNVLMYFTPEQAKAIVGRFQQALIPGGVLIVGAAETSNTLFSPLRAQQTNGVTLYRKRASLDADPVSAPAGTELAAIDPPARPRSAGVASNEPAARRRQSVPHRRRIARSLSEAAPPAPAAEVASLAARAIHCADGRDFGEALRSCERAIAADKMNPAHRYLLAAVQQEMGDADAAIQTLEQVLYLAPDFALAYFSLAQIAIARGRSEDAERHLCNTLAALRGRAVDDLLPPSGDLTAGRLREIVRSLLPGVMTENDSAGVSA